jgi:mono/diheme cytochrome c family protein
MSSTRLARVSFATAVFALSAFAWLAHPQSARSAPNDEPKPSPAASGDKLARGKYLVTVAGCNDCHTPWKMGAAGPEPDMSRMLSGHPEGMELPTAPALPQGPWIVTVAATNTAWSGPWGVSYTANLTPDAETGLGKWTLRDFVATLRTGRHMGKGRPILPPMPIPMYKNFTDQDMDAIFTYLRSIPAVQNRVPEPLPPATTTASTQ